MGDNVDRIQFSIPLGQFLNGLAVTPYYEWAGAGITYAGPDMGVHESIYFRDPDGIGLELIRQPLMEMPESAPEEA